MESVVEIKVLESYKIWIKFSDNTSAELNLKPFLTTGISAHLLEPSYFKKVQIDNMGGISWENGFDFCPITLKKLALKQE